MHRIFSFITLFSFLFAACKPAIVSTPAIAYDNLDEKARRRPENAVAGMKIAEGLELQLFAHEPMIVNPTNLHVDERGRVWVCEAINYRPEHNPENPVRQEGDRILILEDTNGDGKADVQKVFYQGTDVNAALGIWAAGNRAIVSCSPYVFVLTDTNGDDRADQKDTLFSGLDGLQSDHAVHAFSFGPDGKFYFNYGNNGGQLLDQHGKPVLEQTGTPVTNKGKPYRQGMVFRCNPDGSEVEVLGHNFRNNFEVATDAFGVMWQSDNDDDGNKGVRINYVMDYGNFGYTDELTGAGWQTRRINMEAEVPRRHWHQDDPGVVPNVLFTGSGSPCGIMVYEGNLLPAPFQGQMIHCEAGHQVVRAYPVTPDGAGYQGSTVNLIKSQDEWFRPSDACAAPDGSVFVADWYDPAVGGHKFGDPERGRIYRITAKGQSAYLPKPVPMSNLDECAAALGNANLSVRMLAWNKLHEAGVGAIPALEKLWNGKDVRQRARALWLLGKIPGKTAQYVQLALKDTEIDIRATALRLARQSDKEHLTEYARIAANDPSPAVRREGAIGLRYLNTPESAVVWADLAARYDGKDRWYTEALGIGSDLHTDACFEAWRTKYPDAFRTPAGQDIVWRSRSNQALPLLEQLIRQPETPLPVIKRAFRALHFHSDAKKNEHIAALLDVEHPLRDSISTYALLSLDPVFAQKSPSVRKTINRVLLLLKGRAEYIEVVQRLGLKDQNPGLLDMALHNPEPGLRNEAAALLSKQGGLSLLINQLEKGTEADKIQLLKTLGGINSPQLFSLYERYLTAVKTAPSLRRAAMDALRSNWDGEQQLLRLAEAKKLPEAFATQALVQLSGVWNTEIRQKARKLLEAMGQSTGKPIPPVAVLEGKSGNVASGQLVYSTYCSICHQIKGEGVNFGPALDEIGTKLAKEGLYKSILYPSSGINFGYEGYTVKLKDGQQIMGIIESRTETEMTLRLNGGSKRTINMTEVAQVTGMQSSLMPEGLHQSMSEQELIDLVEYLATLKAPENG